MKLQIVTSSIQILLWSIESKKPQENDQDYVSSVDSAASHPLEKARQYRCRALTLERDAGRQPFILGIIFSRNKNHTLANFCFYWLVYGMDGGYTQSEHPRHRPNAPMS